MGGDFNLPDISWTSSKITGHQYSTTKNELFLNLCIELGLTQIISSPTRRKNILDLFFTNNENFY